jgi:hypothetical protein
MALLSAMLLSACGSEPMLLSKSSAVPAGIDLSGFWLVRENLDRARMPVMDEGIERIISENKSQRSRRRRGSDGVSAQVFLEYGESLKITQTAYGIFISYDRSVVEEFTFGENRLVEVGPIEAKRVSGWEGSSFVVETLDESRTTLLEIWHLDKNAAVLVRDIQISKGEDVSFKTQQVFDRQ